LSVHQVAPRQPILLATSAIDVGGDALAEHIFAIETHSQYHGYVIC
jgi:hypothetical protein